MKKEKPQYFCVVKNTNGQPEPLLEALLEGLFPTVTEAQESCLTNPTLEGQFYRVFRLKGLSIKSVTGWRKVK